MSYADKPPGSILGVLGNYRSPENEGNFPEGKMFGEFQGGWSWKAFDEP